MIVIISQIILMKEATHMNAVFNFTSVLVIEQSGCDGTAFRSWKWTQNNVCDVFKSRTRGSANIGKTYAV